MKKLKIYSVYHKPWSTTIKALCQYYQEEMERHIVDNKGVVVGRWLDCRHNIGLGGVYPEWLEFPLVFRVSEGKKYRDVLDTDDVVSNLLISNNLKNVLEQGHVTGWQTYPIKLFDKKGVEVDGYHGFSVIGRGGEFEDKDEYSIHERVIKNIKWKYRLSNWDGSDFFFIKNGGFYITEKVKILFRINKIDSALWFVPWEENIELIE